MDCKFDLSREYGLVLEGGGAKGSYQIGVWKALREVGIRIKGIAGASVGALNGALICMDDLERAEYIWENISYSKVMDVDDDLMDSIHQGDLKTVNIRELLESGKRILKDGGFDITPLRKLIDETVDEEKIRESDRELFVTTWSASDMKRMTIDLKAVPEHEICDMLLASAYLIGFKREKIGGKTYYDGGGWNNVPLDVLIDHDYQDILVIRTYGLGFDTEKIVKVPEGVSVHHIAPRQDLGGILEFNKRKARKNMELGYYDAQRFLYGLEGRFYYLDAPEGEAYYFERMMSEAELTERICAPWLGEKAAEGIEGYRRFTEGIFPEAARELKLKEDWNYKDLYLAVLEDQARQLKVKRFKIYTPDELAKIVLTKLRALDSVPAV